MKNTRFLNRFRLPVWAVGWVLCLALPFLPQAARAEKFKLMGQAKDWKGQNLSDLGVTIWGETIFGTNIDTTLRTDANGRFSLDLYPAIYLDVQLSPYELLDRDYRTIPLRTETTTRSNQLINFVALSAAPTAHLRGFVTNAPSDFIKVTGPFGWAPKFVSVAPDGGFDIPLYAGTWSVTPILQATAPDILAPQMTRTVLDGEDQNDLTLVARTANRRISGDVSIQGKPIAGADVFASTSFAGASYSQSAKTDSDGNFELDVFDGDWQVGGFWFAEQYVDLPPRTVSVAGADQTMHLGSHDSTNQLRGRIVDNLGVAISNAQVFAFGYQPDSLFQQPESDMAGRFSLDVSPGRWSLSFLSAEGLLAPEGRDFLIVEGVVPDEQLFVFQRTNAVLRGAVVDLASNPVPYASLTLSTVTSDSVYTVFASSDEQGRFCIPLFRGEWRIDVQDTYAMHAFTLPERYIDIIAPETSLQLVAQLAGQPSHLRGVVVDGSSAPLVNVSIQAFSWDFNLFPSTTTDASGAFDILADFPGEWSLYASFNDPPKGRHLLATSLDVQVEEGIDQNGIILFAPAATAQITGSLRNEDGQPLPGIDLQASEFFPIQAYGSSATTDSEGRFTLPALTGDWVLSA